MMTSCLLELGCTSRQRLELQMTTGRMIYTIGSPPSAYRVQQGHPVEPPLNMNTLFQAVGRVHCLGQRANPESAVVVLGAQHLLLD